MDITLHHRRRLLLLLLPLQDSLRSRHSMRRPRRTERSSLQGAEAGPTAQRHAATEEEQEIRM